MSDHRLPDGTHAVLLSADTPALLRAEAAALLDYLANRPATPPDRVSEMLFRSRTVRRVRALAAVTDRDELVSALGALATGAPHPAVSGGDTPATELRHGFVFPGQGGQRPGMAALFHEFSPAFRAEAQRCDALFGELFGVSPLKYALGTEAADTESSVLVQPALFVQMAALAAMWRAAGIEPAATIGHSQGEIAAAYVAGKLDLRDAVFLVGTRAAAVDRLAADRYAMAVAATDRDECEELLARRTGWAQLSVINAPRFVAISGDHATVAEIVAALTARGRFARIIRVPYPAHTDLLDRTRDDLTAALGEHFRDTAFHDSGIDCFGATLGGPITADLPLSDYWFWNLRNTVRFDKAVASAVTAGVNSFVELAEHPTLVAAVQDNLDGLGATAAVTATSDRDARDARAFGRALAALAVGDLNFRWETLDTAPDRIRLPLRGFPNVQLDEQRFWLPYNTAPPDTAAVSGAAGRTDDEPGRTSVPGPRPAPARLLVQRWARQSQRSLLPPRALGFVDHTGECADLVAGLCAQAEVFGASGRPLRAGESTAGLDAVVVLLPDSPDSDVTAAGEDLAEFLGSAAWWPGDLGPVTDIWLLTRGGEQLDGDPPRRLFHSAAAAGFRSIGPEHPGVSFRHLDLAPGPVDELAAFAVVAALHTAAETELVLRDRDQYVKRIVEHPHATEPAAEPAGRYGEVLIVGGTGRIGLEFCEYFARHGARRVTLLGRSGETPAVAARLDPLRRAGAADIAVHAVDIRDRAAVAELAGEFRDRPVDIVVHTAVEYSDADLADVDAEAVRSAVATKIGGIDTVLDLIPRTEHCAVLVSSSIASTLSGRGQIVYAATNRMLDAYADRQRATGLRCHSVQWGRWTVHLDLGATGSAKLDAMGATPMDPSDAIPLGLRALGENTLVAAFDWEHTAFVLSPYGYGPVLSELSAAPPGSAASAPARAPAPPSVAAGEVEPRLRTLIAEVLGARDGAAIAPGQALVALGLDSLLALGLRRRVKAEFDRDIPVAELLNGATLETVVRLVGADTGAAAHASSGQVVTTEPFRDVEGGQPDPGVEGGQPGPALAVRPARTAAVPPSGKSAAMSSPEHSVVAPPGTALSPGNPVALRSADRPATGLPPGLADPAGSVGETGAARSPGPSVAMRSAAESEPASPPMHSVAGQFPGESVAVQAAEHSVANPASGGSAVVPPPGQPAAVRFAESFTVTRPPARSTAVPVPDDSEVAAAARSAADSAVPAGTDADVIRSARDDVDLFGMRAMLDTLDPVLGDGTAHPADEIALRTGFRERHRWLLRRWLAALTEHGALVHDPGTGYRRVRAVQPPRRRSLDVVCADLGYPAELAAFLQATTDDLPRIVQDEVRVQELLFPDGAMRTAEALYTDNLISHYLNVGAGAFVGGLADRIAQDRTPVRILELGAGIGGLTGTVAARLGDRPVDYHFTDLSSFFLEAARERFAAYPWMRYGLADLNADLGRPGTYDIVLAANVLHNAQHIGTTLRQLHDLLAPGGAVVFVEVCRAHMQLLTSVHFLMSPPAGQPLVGTADVRSGTDRIMLTESEWRAELAGAGFRVLEVLPHAGHPLFPLDQRVFAAVRNPDGPAEP